LNFQNGAGPAHRANDGEARRVDQLGGKVDFLATPQHEPLQAIRASQRAHALHYGRSRKLIVRIVPDASGLYRIDWPDIGLSPAANLSRCRDAALQWAEQQVLRDLRKKRGVGALKSLDKFSWSASPMRQNGRGRP
jgi:hypothetical protein